MPTKAIIAGIVPVLAESEASWPFVRGTSPAESLFAITPEHQRYLQGLPMQPVTLRLETREGKSVTIENLWIMDFPPGPNPHICYVRLADRRWFWKYVHILRRYNIRRNIGYRTAETNMDFGLYQTPPIVWYARYSLRDPDASIEAARWTARTAMENVVKAVLAAEKDVPGGTEAPALFELAHMDVPVENLEIDDSGDVAIGRVLSYFPEGSIFVTPKGEVVVYGRAGGGESVQLNHLATDPNHPGAAKVGQGYVDFCSSRRTRPREIHVLFSREIEVRFDFKAPTSAIQPVTTTGGSSDARIIENVLPVPDPWIMVRDMENPPAGNNLWPKLRVCQGAWITFEQALWAWHYNDMAITVPNVSFEPIVLDHDIIERAMVPRMDLWECLGLAGLLTTNADWAARISAVCRHWRRTFRINRRWVDAYLSVRAYRCATIDRASGQRAPAQAWSDYTIFPTRRAHYKYWTGPIGGAYAINVPGWRANLSDPQLRSCPITVSVEDADQGILHLDYQIDPLRYFEQAIPGTIVEASMPVANIVQIQQGLGGSPVTADMLLATENPVRFAPAHQCSILVTLIPAAPNDTRQLHKIVVKPEDVKDMIPLAAQRGLQDAQGPVYQARVNAGLEVARVRWNDERAADIEACFGLANKEPDLTGLVTNESDQSDLQHGGSLHAIAKAVAARLWASWTDHYQGAVSGDLLPDARIIGWIDELRHGIAASGEGFTRMSLPAQIEPMNLLAFVDDSTRAIIMRLANPRP